MGTSSRSASASEHRRWLPAGVVPAAVVGLGWLGIWLAIWSGAQHSVLVQVPQLDELHYLRAAQAISQGHWLPTEPFYMSPLYPYLVALTGGGAALDGSGLLSNPPLGLWFLQAILWGGVAQLLHRVAVRVQVGWGRPPGSARRLALVPAALFVLYRPAAIFALLPLLEIPLTLLVVALLALLDRWLGPPHAPSGVATSVRGPSPAAAAGAGVLIGLAALLRAHALLLLIPALAALRLAPPGRAGRRPAGERWRRRRCSSSCRWWSSTACGQVVPPG